MGVLARAIAAPHGRKGVYERWVELLNGLNTSKAGPSVNLVSAFRQASAFACMRVISQGPAQLPFKLYRETEEDGLRRLRPARDHAAYDLVDARPNGWQTSFELIEQLVLHASLGNGYVFKNAYRGNLAELIVLHPGRVRAEQKDDWTVTYKVRGKSGGEVEIPADQMWHLRGPSWDGFLGLDVLDAAKEALGLAIALDESVAGLHANGVRPSGVYSVEGTLNKEQHTALVAWLKKEAASPHAPLVLDRGAKWLQQTMSSLDAQTREMRQTQVEEVCRFFGVMPIMIGHTGDKANTYASAEAMFTAHRVFTLAPWLRRIEKSADVNLLTDAERKSGLYFKFTVNAMLHATAKDQGEYFAKALGSGGAPAWLTQDEIRELIERDPMGGTAAQLPVATNKPAPPADPAP